MADLDAAGNLVYRDAADVVVRDPERRMVLARVPDPLPSASAGHVHPSPADPL